MTDQQYDSFLDNIIQSLEKNGYPGKRVALPLERMYEVAHGKGLNFNKALTYLDERGIAHEKSAERLIFFPKTTAKQPSMLEMMAEAQKAMAAMTPEQRDELMKMYQNMTAEQKAEITKKAQELGLG